MGSSILVLPRSFQALILLRITFPALTQGLTDLLFGLWLAQLLVSDGKGYSLTSALLILMIVGEEICRK
jgi:hypothetical protein